MEPEDVPAVSVSEDPPRYDGPLPAPVRTRVVSLAADCLDRLPSESLPASLKRVAAFTRNRRAKLAGSQIAAVLDSDDAFREEVGAQVRTMVGELPAALDGGEVPAAADPVEIAAVAFLLRSPGWADLVLAAEQEVEIDQAAGSARQAREKADRVRHQLYAVTEELKAARQRSKEQLADLKAENTELRRKLRDARARAKAAESAAARVEAEAAEAVATASAAATAADAEARRLRGRVEELERESTALRRSERTGREEETLRVRLLLDTVLDSAQGLRRELALPPAAGRTPADQVEAHEAEPGNRSHSSHGALGPDDPALLDQLIALPRAHMIVDGYNVTKTAWPDLSLEKQRDRLLNGLAPLVARSGAEVTVVFDAAESRDRPVVNKPRGVRVLFTQHGVIADDLIRDLVAAEPRGRAVVVVTSDRQIVRDIERSGFRVVASGALVRLLARG